MKLFLPLLLVVFWNVENFFEGRPYFTVKCNAVAKTLLMIADSEGSLPDVIAFAEIGSRPVLEKLIYRTVLRKCDYRIVHFDSPDRRGIDCALLYRKSSFQSVTAKACNLCDSAGRSLRTRDILLFEGDSLNILVNHHPSKVGKDSELKRRLAMNRMWEICDSLSSEDRTRILCIGDFNENLWGPFEQGSVKYNGVWDKIDGVFCKGLVVDEKVFAAPHLMERDKSFGGLKPRRTWIGPRWNGGVSDHLPLVILLQHP